jgi:hypothetical protein
MMNDFQTCIFLVFPWKNNLGQPEAEMGTFLSRRSTDFSKRRAARGLGSRRSSPNRRRRWSLAPATARRVAELTCLGISKPAVGVTCCGDDLRASQVSYACEAGVGLRPHLDGRRGRGGRLP